MARKSKRSKQDKVIIRNKAAKEFCKALNIQFAGSLEKIATNACEKMKTTDNLYLLPVFLEAVNHVDLDKTPEEPWTGDPLIKQWAKELGMTDENFNEEEDPNYNDYNEAAGAPAPSHLGTEDSAQPTTGL